jgi:hypothetical protein
MEAKLFPDAADVLVLYSVPFSIPGREGYAGVAYAAIRLETIDLTLRNIDVGDSGYAFVISRDGEYLVHPRTELVRRGATLFETAWADGNTGLHKIAVRAIQGETLFSESPDEVTGRDNWIFAEPLTTTGWSVFAVFFRDEFRPDTDEERRHLIGITLFGLVGLWMFVVAVSAAGIPDHARLAWACSNSLGVVLVGLMVLCWYVADLYPQARLSAQNVIFDQGSAHEFLNRAGIDDRMEASTTSR